MVILIITSLRADSRRELIIRSGAFSATLD